MDGGVAGAALLSTRRTLGVCGGVECGRERRQRKKERIEENVTATILVAMAIPSSAPTGRGAVNTKGGKRPRAIQRVFFYCIRRRGERGGVVSPGGRMRANRRKTSRLCLPSLSAFLPNAATFQEGRVKKLVLYFIHFDT